MPNLKLGSDYAIEAQRIVVKEYVSKEKEKYECSIYWHWKDQLVQSQLVLNYREHYQ